MEKFHFHNSTFKMAMVCPQYNYVESHVVVVFQRLHRLTWLPLFHFSFSPWRSNLHLRLVSDHNTDLMTCQAELNGCVARTACPVLRSYAIPGILCQHKCVTVRPLAYRTKTFHAELCLYIQTYNVPC